MKRLPTAIAASMLAAAAAMSAPRIWTNQEGRTVEAEFGGIENGNVRLRMTDGKPALVPLASLSAKDQAWALQQPPQAAADRRRMPDSVKEPLLHSDIRAVVEKPGEHVYESTHFRFRTTEKLGASLLKDVSRAFESTHELVRQMPWGIQPRPEEGRSKFEAVLHVNRAAYLATGAPTWSAGIYSLKDKVFHIPYEEIGVAGNAGASGYFRKGAINNDTITHEITHQMMHSIVPCMPIWLVEGLAEYTSNLPYQGGEFRVSEDGSIFEQKNRRFRGLSARMFQRRNWLGVDHMWRVTRSMAEQDAPAEPEPPPPPPPPVKPGESMAPTPARTPPKPPSVFIPINPVKPVVITPEMLLAARYHSSHLLAYFFVRDRGGLPLRKYFEAVHAEAPKWPLFWKQVEAYRQEVEALRPAYEAYEREVADFLKQPGVEKLPDGRVSYPVSLTPPSPPPQVPKPPQPPDGTSPEKLAVKHLDILLDGRSLMELEEQCCAMFAKLGYRIFPVY